MLLALNVCEYKSNKIHWVLRRELHPYLSLPDCLKATNSELSITKAAESITIILGDRAIFWQTEEDSQKEIQAVPYISLIGVTLLSAKDPDNYVFIRWLHDEFI